MRSYTGVVFVAAVALFGVLSSVEANPFPYPIAKPNPNEGLLLQADLDITLNLVEAVDIIIDAAIAKLLPLVLALLPYILPILEYLFSCIC